MSDNGGGDPLLIASRKTTSRPIFAGITPPAMDSAERNKYKSNVLSSTAIDIETLDEIVGELTDDSDKLVYFSRREGGMIYRFPSKVLEEKRPELVEEYKEKKAEGRLSAFDPSSAEVHPLSRVHLVLSLPKRTKSSSGSNGTASEVEYIDVDSEEDEEDVQTEDESSQEDNNGTPLRRSTRTRKPRQLPFSPKKTRSRQPIITVESDSDRPAQPTRRSTRVRNDKPKAADDDYSANESDFDSEISTRRTTKGKPANKKVIRGKASRPAYGFFRDINDLRYDQASEDAALRAHRDICEKCVRGPAHKLIEKERKKPERRKRKQTSDDEFEEQGNEEDKLAALGGWVRCLKCPVVAHWSCLASTQRDEILKAARDRDRAEWRSKQDPADLQDAEGNPIVPKDQPGKRPGLNENQLTDFICGSCIKGALCMHCDQVAVVSDAVEKTTPGPVEDVQMADATETVAAAEPDLLFRCRTCKRVAHYEHLPPPDDMEYSKVELASYYQQDWQCADCNSFVYELDVILAWRPHPANAVEPLRKTAESLNYKSPLPREYLVKWLDRSYRRIQWVPHAWLLAKHQAKLKNFIASGTRVDLLADPVSPENVMDVDSETTFEIGADASREASSVIVVDTHSPIPDAEARIPSAWKTIDRVLDIMIWRGDAKSKKAKRPVKSNRIESDESDNEGDDPERERVFSTGEQPHSKKMQSVSDWERQSKKSFTVDQIDLVVWVFTKWDDLGYDQSSWDSPPKPGEMGYKQFQIALDRFLLSRTIHVPSSIKGNPDLGTRQKGKWRKTYTLKEGQQPSLGQNSALKLMPFQVDGYNWLCNNWWNSQPCILADEMGLGKTVQIAAFVGSIVAQFKAFPILIVVPNSTITNWVRELVRWAPALRVVPFYGEHKAREVIKKYELFHDKSVKAPKGTTGAKFHVLVTTYETLTNTKDFTPVFKSQPRWEALIVDEGQRLKSDSSLLFKKLNELNTIHRIIMTGTPLNNNIRELFNLMNFLDPDSWNDLEELEKEHEELTEDLVKALHERLRPYFLRRIKSQVLTLPPKNEVIVPISMAPLQKEVYRSILSHNLDILNELSKPAGAQAKTKTKINNVLMQLRKCLQHPYLYDQDIEPQNLPQQETHEKLIDASGKLRFLKTLLPKLKAKGHRVLLFSQFVISLNIIEDFLVGEGLKYLRLDGNTKGADRQKGMDEFNRPGSDIFIYLLTTRAGGVGINLWSADTVIISDPDFNPHQDLQAIARAYRYGQKKTCLVFKLMVKDSAEERIVQVGRKKMVLDHLIVQKMDDDETGGDNVQSILTFGAKALFEDSEGTRDIHYSEQDVEKLITKTETEGDAEAPKDNSGLSFEFAQVWAADKDTLEDLDDDPVDDQGDSWAQTLQRITTEREKVIAQEVTGRGARRRAALNAEERFQVDGTTPIQNKSHKDKDKESAKDSHSDGGYSYSGSDDESTTKSHSVPPEADELAALAPQPKTKKEKSRKEKLTEPLKSRVIKTDNYFDCGLCGKRHGDKLGDCPMTEKSEYLADYREMLLLHADDEPLEHRRIAISAIDEVLRRRGHLDLVCEQPLSLVEVKPPPKPKPVRKSLPASASLPKKAGQASSSTVSIFRLTDSTTIRSRDFSTSSKRALSPTREQPPKKKQNKQNNDFDPSVACIICCQSPHHLIKDCPAVREGVPRVEREIARLGQDSQNESTVAILKKILFKLKRTAPSRAEEPIEISD